MRARAIYIATVLAVFAGGVFQRLGWSDGNGF